MNDLSSIDKQIKIAEKELAELDVQRTAIQNKIQKLKRGKESASINDPQGTYTNLHKVTSDSSENEKISLFRSLFKGREDVFPRRFLSKTTGKSGYQPACRNEWIKGICLKPKIKCNDCNSRDFIPVSNDTIRNHLMGRDTKSISNKDFTIGIYPLLKDETCWFLTVDFDEKSWIEDSKVYLEICRSFGVPAVLERSRSGNGGHIWIFFSEPISAGLVRKMGVFILTQAMEKRPEIGFDSYDRFFPSQDTLPKGGFGNLIALPLQKIPREIGNSVFVDDDVTPYQDQWVFLSSVRRMTSSQVQKIVDKATSMGDVLGVKYVGTYEDEIEPWKYSPSGGKPEIQIQDPLPENLEIVLGNQIYIKKDLIPPALLNRLIRLAAFQNPEFYKAQAMRFPTYDKPRIVHCCEDFDKYIGLPRGCLDDISELLVSLNIKIQLKDERCSGVPISVVFKGKLRLEQEKAADAMLEYDIGTLSASTAFGKTVVAAYLIAKRSVNTLILVHRKHLIDQWRAHLINFLNIAKDDIGQIGGGKNKPSGIIDIAMIQTLSKRGVVNDIVEKYGHLVVDECHHISARSFEIVARQCKAKYITGLSATIVRKDGHHPIIFMNCGPLRYRVDDKKQALKRPFAHKVIVKRTECQFKQPIESGTYTAIHDIYNALINNNDRNKMIVEDILRSISENRFPVILTERKEHLDKLKSLLEDKVKNLIIMQGGMGKKQSKAAMDKLKSLSNESEKAILATGKYLGEGFDEKRLDTLFLTLPISWKGTLNQYAGRLHRIHDMKKEVIIYDYADLEIPMLAKMYKRRLKGYRSIGYEIMNVQIV